MLLLVSGFILSKSNVPPWWVWAFWISPITYTQQALSINEMLDPRWDVPTTYNGQNTTVGLATLEVWRRFAHASCGPNSTLRATLFFTHNSTDAQRRWFSLQAFGLFNDKMYVWLGAVVLLGYTALFQVSTRRR